MRLNSTKMLGRYRHRRIYRIYDIGMCIVSPVVLQLQLQLENMHIAAFKEGDSLEDVDNRPLLLPCSLNISR
jgi:hypothetical protein